jgi:hypothetical protein
MVERRIAEIRERFADEQWNSPSWTHIRGSSTVGSD